MTPSIRVPRWLAFLLLIGLPVWGATLRAAEAHYQVQLVWGTDDPNAKSGDMKVLAPEIRERLRQLRWKSYFVVKSEVASIPAKESKRVTLSDRCAVELKELPNGHLEVKMFSLKPGSDSKEVASKTMSLKELVEGKLIIYAGDSKDRWDDAWLVIVGGDKPAAPAKP
jgi:hypothetical protein